METDHTVSIEPSPPHAVLTYVVVTMSLDLGSNFIVLSLYLVENGNGATGRSYDQLAVAVVESLPSSTL